MPALLDVGAGLPGPMTNNYKNLLQQLPSCLIYKQKNNDGTKRPEESIKQNPNLVPTA